MEFFWVAGMLAIAGCIDGTHMRIESPIGNEQQYANWHGYQLQLMSCVFVVLTENFFVLVHVGLVPLMMHRFCATVHNSNNGKWQISNPFKMLSFWGIQHIL